MSSINMDNIMSANLTENTGQIRVTFKKTIQKKQYEPEVTQVEAALNIDKNVGGGERMLITALVSAQVEYTAFVTMLYKGSISEEEFEQRRSALIMNIEAVKSKAEELEGKSLDYIIK